MSSAANRPGARNRAMFGLDPRVILSERLRKRQWIIQKVVVLFLSCNSKYLWNSILFVIFLYCFGPHCFEDTTELWNLLSIMSAHSIGGNEEICMFMYIDKSMGEYLFDCLYLFLYINEELRSGIRIYFLY